MKMPQPKGVCMQTMSMLIKGWRSCSRSRMGQIYPDDKDVLKEKDENRCCFRSLQKYTVDEFGQIAQGNGTRLHLGLTPVPYMGNIATASIYILMLNPGLKHSDYFAEQSSAAFRLALANNLHQKNLSQEFPFMLLDPQFSWHSGFEYWERKLSGITDTILRNGGAKSPREAMSKLAKKLACLELMPYHSRTFGDYSLLKKLKSAQAMQAFAKDLVMHKAENDMATVIVTRGARHWNLPISPTKNVIVYECVEARAAHLTPKAKKAILRRLEE